MQRTIISGLLLISSCYASLFIPAADPLIFHTNWNWWVNTTVNSIEAANPGSYVKLSFTSTSKIILVLDQPQRDDYFANVAWSLDNGPFFDYSLGNDTRVKISTNLSTSENHTLFVYYKNNNGWIDRWLGPSVNMKILGFEADDGAIFRLPSDLMSLRMLVYWDSIGEGGNTVDVHHNNFDIQRNDALPTFAFSAAEAVGAELSLMAWGGQGLSVGAPGNIPPLWDASGASNASSWNWHNIREPRSFQECPDIILNGHGTNDGLGRRSVAEVAPCVLGWLKSMRSTCPQSRIFQVVPFGLFSKEAVVTGFNEYQKFKSDKKTHLIELKKTAAKGLDHIAPSWCSGDGIHPWGWRSSQLGAQLAREIIKHIK